MQLRTEIASKINCLLKLNFK